MSARPEPVNPGPDRILVIIPTYNELDALPKILERVQCSVPLAEMLIVDDNSPDGTGKVADEWASDHAQIHVMHRMGKGGLGAAYLAGFAWGLQQGFDVLVEMDADGSHQPEQLPTLLAALEYSGRELLHKGYARNRHRRCHWWIPGFHGEGFALP